MPKPARSDKSAHRGNSSTSDDSASADVPAMSFEQSMAELQQIVSELEENSLGLEASLAQFERGIGLLRNCHLFLEQAEQKIEILLNFNANGEPTTAPFDAAPTVNNPETKTLF
jgi:exodeoxyribonuclease VII small subunit